MRYLSVCSGIEAATVAWEPLGWEAVAYSEIEKFPSAVLKHHYPDVPNLGDMTNYREWETDGTDLVVGGTPCQSFSVAGLRAGMDDPRGNLALVFCGLVEQVRPRWVVWENVPGVLSSDEGRDFGAFLGGLAELGYGVAYRVLDAQYFGLAQRRKRVFVVGCLGDWRGPAAVLLERSGLYGDPSPGRETGSHVAGTLEAGAGRRRGDSQSVGSLTAAGVGTCGADDNQGQAGHLVAHTLKGEGFDASEDGTGRGTPIIPFDTTQITSKTNRCQPKAGDPCHPLAAGAHPPSVAFTTKDHGQDATEDLAPTLRAMPGDHANGGGQIGVQQGLGVRRLTPRECERLQGFPDDYTLVPYRKKPAADGPRYKALGNSMAVPVMRWIGERIALVDSLLVGMAQPT